MTTAIIVAAGQGTRFGPDRDKLFFEVAGRPVVAHTWQRFEDCAGIDHIVLVIRDGMQTLFQELAGTYAFKKPYSFAVGGKERQDSVWSGLDAAPSNTSIVAIQDGARPCTHLSIIESTIAAARESGAAVAAQAVTDTIKSSDTGITISGHLDRSKLWAVQTPQCFRLTTIRHALSEVRQRGLLVTDDTAACELIGQTVRLVPSAFPNPKVTMVSDLLFVELLLNSARPGVV
ncbi:MAG: 2-C-methyl-D-erythritol 4-phosphate cytidylyltransferase [Verrucomicrobia bacterium]|nr:2-C-methyl-D-erythritol 4-phosphate cytidylyltransferase [Verrucomicrobiota bacterium]